MLVAILSGFAVAPSFSLQWKETPSGQALSIREGGNSFTFPPERPRLIIRRADGTTADFGDPTKACLKIVVKSGGRKGSLEMKAVQARWLESDRYWGDGKAGNDMRFLNASGGGIYPVISEAVAIGKRWLAVVSWRAKGPSGEPLRDQHLAWLETKPAPSLRFLRRIGALGESLYLPPPARLVRIGKSWGLIERGQVVRLDAAMASGARFASLPKDVDPAGRAGRGRYVVFGPSRVDGAASGFSFLDLVTGKVGRHRLDSAGIAYVSESEPAVVAEAGTGSLKGTFIRYDLLAGWATKLVLPKGFRPDAIWRKWVLRRENGQIRVVDWRTGKLVTQLRIPVEPKP